MVLTSTATAIPAEAREVTARHFWKSAAAAATATVYAPKAKALRQAGLGPLQPIGDATLQMVCSGEWNVAVTYDAENGNTSASVYRETRHCQPDFGAGDSPQNPSSVRVSGARLTIVYEGCASTPEGQTDPIEADCAPKDAEHALYGTLPGASGKRATAIHLDTVGLTRPQIRSLVRSLSPVPT